MGEILSLDDYSPAARPAVTNRSGRNRHVFFNRLELNQILNVYGFMVAKGEWRDYAISHDQEACTFAVFRRSADGALFRIVKRPKLANRQGAYAVVSFGGQVLKRGRTLQKVLEVFDTRRLQAVE